LNIPSNPEQTAGIGLENIGSDSLINLEETEQATQNPPKEKKSIYDMADEILGMIENGKEEFSVKFGGENIASGSNMQQRIEKIIPKLPDSIKKGHIISAPNILIPSTLTLSIYSALQGIDRRNSSNPEKNKEGNV